MVCKGRFKKNSTRLYGVRAGVLFLCLLQDFVVLYRRYHAEHLPQSASQDEEQSAEDWIETDIYQDFDREKEIKLGWLIFKPFYVLWVFEVLYLLISMWVSLSLVYWANIEHMTRHEFLSILHWEYHAPPKR